MNHRGFVAVPHVLPLYLPFSVFIIKGLPLIFLRSRYIIGIWGAIRVVEDVLSTLNHTFNRYAATFIRNCAAIAAIYVYNDGVGKLSYTKSYS
jgi:hypothetical protein